MKQIAILTFFLCSHSFASLPRQAEDVEVIEITDTENTHYENFQKIVRDFPGANSKELYNKIMADCKEWVIKQMKDEPAPYFKAYCSKRKDIILRQYEIKAHLLIKSWSN